MPHDCPYCGELVMGEPEDTEVDDGFVYSEVWRCESCGKKFKVEYEFCDHFLDEQGMPIPEREE